MQWTPEKLDRVRALVASGSSMRHIMGELRVGRHALQMAMQRHGISANPTTRHRATGWHGEPTRDVDASIYDCEDLPDA